MLYKLFLPQWDAEGPVIASFTVQVGEQVQKGQLLMVLGFIDEKAVMEIESPVDGAVQSISIQFKETVSPGQLVMLIDTNQRKK